MSERPVTLCFLWHMHQPPYRVGGERACFMPWVRLHAVHSYYDMVRVLEEFPEIRVTFNLTPILVEQLRAYERGASDLFQEAGRTPAESLSESQRRFLVANFFSVDERRVIRSHPRFAALLDKRNAARAEHGREHEWRVFSTGELRDLQVLFALAWFGFKAREAFPELAALQEHPGSFDQAQLERIHAIERVILSELLDRYRSAAKRGSIEISTSPYFHPILPLLVDSDCAREAQLEDPLPPAFRAPEDALAQLETGLDLIERELGVRPAGIWPPEGSVSPPVAELLAGCGAAWAASDAQVLARSDRSGPEGPYRPWTVAGAGEQLALVFRDHDLADRIGFAYQSWHARDAVADLLNQSVDRARGSRESDPLVLIALDGENAWEHYPGAGRWFLRELYRAIQEREDVSCETVGAAIARRPERGTIRRLHSGSWIYANFATWIGGPQKNQVWTVLGELRAQLRHALASASAARRREAEACLLAAEASDWFWWLDGQYKTEYASEFDRLQRAHLARAFTLLDLPVPAVLNASLVAVPERAHALSLEPAEWIDPDVTGAEQTPSAWGGASRLSWAELRPTGAMERGSAPFESLRIGFSRDGDLFLRIDGRPERPLVPGLRRVALSVQRSDERRELSLELDAKGGLHAARCEVPTGPEQTSDREIDGTELTVAFDDFLALRASHALLGVAPGASARLQLRIEGAAGEVALRPLDVRIPTPDRATP